MSPPVPTWRLAAAAASLAAVVLAVPGPPGWGFLAAVAANAALAVVAVADWAAAPRPSRIAVSRSAPAVVALGRPATVAWRVANPGRRAVRVDLADELAPSLGAASRRARVRVPPGGAATASTGIAPSRRGRFEPTELTVRAEGPLGLVARQEARRLPGVIRVYPAFRSREEADLRINRARLLEVGMRSAAAHGGGTEFDALRDYGADDEFRRIDWAATARAGRPIVRTYRSERNQTVIVLLDAGRTMAPQVGGVPRFDHALDAVMALTSVASRLGDRAGLVVFDQAVRAVVAPGHGRDQLRRVTEALYRADPELVESDYRGAFAQTLARFHRRSMLVLLTELAEAAVTESLLPAVPLLARHSLLVVAGVTDPQVGEWARAAAGDAGSTYRKAAATAALASRQRTSALLARAGATVVDAEPGRLAPALADAYLRAKAAGRL